MTKHIEDRIGNYEIMAEVYSKSSLITRFSTVRSWRNIFRIETA